MGGRLRSFHAIAELSRRHRVTVLTTHGPADDPTGLADHLEACERGRLRPLRDSEGRHAAVRRRAGSLLALALSGRHLEGRVPALRARCV